MPLFRNSPFEDLIAQATNEQNVSEDWSAIMDICDKVVNYEDGQKFCLQAITKRLYHKVPRVVMQALVLLDACVQNCGKKFHLEVSSRYFVTEIQKLLPKMHVSASEKLKQLIRRWAENEFKDDPELGLVPSLYYKLKSEGVEFPAEKDQKSAPAPVSTDPNVVSCQQEEEDIIKAIALSLNGLDSSPVRDDSTDSSSTSSVPTTNPMKVRALYDFEAVEDNELTIKAGEVVLILDRSNNSWWKGSNHRGEGYIPANFVTENLDQPIEHQNAVVDEEQTLPKEVDDSIDEVFSIDEEKIQQTLDWLSDVDPTNDTEDPEELLVLERQCYAMAPLIEQKLQQIDKKCTALNSLNEELVKAVQLFYSLNSLGNPVTNANTAILCMDHLHSRETNTAARQPNYALKTSSVAVPPSTHFIPVDARNVAEIQYSEPSQQSFASYCYQPLYTVLSPEAASGYHVPNLGVPASSKTVSQPLVTSSGCNNSNSSIVNSGNTNLYTSSALPNAGSVPVVYQPVVLQPQFSSGTLPGGLAYATYPSGVPVQQHGSVMHPQTMNSYIPQYIAQVVMPGDNGMNPQETNLPTTSQANAELSANSQNNTESIHPSPATHAASEEMHVATSEITVEESAFSNSNCSVKSSI